MNRNLIERLDNRVLMDSTLGADFNYDGQVNGQDFTILSMNFAQPDRTFQQGDATIDKKVNALDFNVLASTFGEQIMAETWVGGTSGAWDTNANWFDLSKPTAGQDVIVPDILGLTNPPGAPVSPITLATFTVADFRGNNALFPTVSTSGNSTINDAAIASVGTVSGIMAGFSSDQFTVANKIGGTLNFNGSTDVTTCSGSITIGDSQSPTALHFVAGSATLLFTATSQTNNPNAFIDSGFTGTISGANGISLDLNSSTLNASAALAATSGTFTASNYSQGAYAGCEGFTVTGGLGTSKAQGATYAGTISANRIASGFNSSSYTIRFTGPDDTADVACTTSAFSVTVPSTIGVGSTTVRVLDDSHNIIINLDTITVTAAPTADISGDGIIGHVQGGSYANFTPTSATVGGVAMTGFSANAGTWTATLGATTPTGSQAAVLNPGAVAAGNITVVAALTGTPSQNRLGIGLGLGL